jgi:hypothetical protein
VKQKHQMGKNVFFLQTETTKPTKTSKKKKNIYENVQNVTLQNGKSQLIEFDVSIASFALNCDSNLMIFVAQRPARGQLQS